MIKTSTSEKCLKCHKRGYPDPACDPRTCTVVFGVADLGDSVPLTTYIKCPNCGATLDFCAPNPILY